MNILILGGNGFIGSHLVDAFINDGAKVRVLDRPQSLRHDPLPGVDYRFADFQDQSNLAEALIDIDLVIHLVSSTVPSTSNLDAIADIEGNLVGSVKLMNQMRQIGNRRMIFLSSGGTVYGNPASLPVPETHPLNPISSYGIVKVAIEQYLGMYQQLYGISSTILRVSNPFGPRQSHLGVQGVIPTFFHRILEGESIKVWGTGDNVRDYIYIDDLVSAVVAASKRDAPGIYNIGAGTGTSLLDLIKTVSQASGVEPKIEFLPERDFDVKAVVLDIAKAAQTFDWQPRIGLQDGCQQYWQWLQKARS